MLILEDFKPKYEGNKKLPPGQYEDKGFPVLSLGPTPKIDINEWKFEIAGMIENPFSLTWEELNELPKVELTKDIHCVTKWSKFATKWTAVPLDEIILKTKLKPSVTHIVALSYDGYTTNMPLADVIDGKAWIAISYDGQPLAPEHGGPARLLVPHLYFWKSAKWVNKIVFQEKDTPGFWETRGYHNHGDPFREQRYTDDQ
jgi:DMSO/TMAO reductase YedYZ molybdopterin-dependent catalytic subunit